MPCKLTGDQIPKPQCDDSERCRQAGFCRRHPHPTCGVAPAAPPWEGYLHHWHNAGYPIAPVGVKVGSIAHVATPGFGPMTDATRGVETGDGSQQREVTAREIYEGWRDEKGWVPWVEGGNSLMQDKARREAAPGVPVAHPTQPEQPR